MDANAAGWWVTPFLTGALGVIAAYFGVKFDLRKSANQEFIKKRIAIYDTAAPLLNEILCFYLCSGSWRSLSPDKILENKRTLALLWQIMSDGITFGIPESANR